MTADAASPDFELSPREPDRVSRLSVAALVLGLLSCLPVVGFIAAVLGVVSLGRIGRSGGRLGGRTFAAVGMTFGLIASILWLSLALGARQEYARYKVRFVEPASAYLTAVLQGDMAAARAPFEPGAAPGDEAVRAFAEAVKTHAGAPAGPLAGWADFKEVPSASRMMPMPEAGHEYAARPMRFERGMAFVLARMAPGRKETGAFPSEGLDEVVVVAADGTVARLKKTEGTR